MEIRQKVIKSHLPGLKKHQLALMVPLNLSTLPEVFVVPMKVDPAAPPSGM